MLVDTHCHIHESDYPLPIDATLQHAREAGVQEMICVGTSEKSSSEAILFAKDHEGTYASIGVHPHESKEGYEGISSIVKESKVVAIGEIGLDYFYTHSSKEVQIAALQWQIELALANNLPAIFHVREAFDDFWPIFDSYSGIRGVLHSFTDTKENLQKALDRGLYIGVNGISTFSKDPIQKAMFASIPLAHLLVETDAPFLTPNPFRGKVNEPAFVKNIAQHHADIRNISYDEVAVVTTSNAHALFAL
jgi:TatD DNase family protein